MKRPPKPQPALERRDFTFRPDDRTWDRLKRYLRALEDEQDKLPRPKRVRIPSRNDVVLEALNAWLDVVEAERKRR